MVGYTMVPGVYPDPDKIPKTDEYIYVAEDGWSIKYEENRYIFSFVDPGHSGRLIKMEVLKDDNDFARANHPSFNEFLGRLTKLERANEVK